MLLGLLQELHCALARQQRRLAANFELKPWASSVSDQQEETLVNEGADERAHEGGQNKRQHSV
jgi:hypothetical protein